MFEPVWLPRLVVHRQDLAVEDVVVVGGRLRGDARNVLRQRRDVAVRIVAVAGRDGADAGCGDDRGDTPAQVGAVDELTRLHRLAVRGRTAVVGRGDDVGRRTAARLRSRRIARLRKLLILGVSLQLGGIERGDDAVGGRIGDEPRFYDARLLVVLDVGVAAGDRPRRVLRQAGAPGANLRRTLQSGLRRR